MSRARNSWPIAVAIAICEMTGDIFEFLLAHYALDVLSQSVIAQPISRVVERYDPFLFIVPLALPDNAEGLAVAVGVGAIAFGGDGVDAAARRLRPTRLGHRPLSPNDRHHLFKRRSSHPFRRISPRSRMVSRIAQ